MFCNVRIATWHPVQGGVFGVVCSIDASNDSLEPPLARRLITKCASSYVMFPVLGKIAQLTVATATSSKRILIAL
jgi:hypothetical protein